ncbi:MAG TPA: ectoine/hydroxyectoine ABC transporter permease subunit EhuD [Acidimicrobiia bacterium]|nr:ectoine/hydroxyectoine ABC transporter permease subunit EhuD [Acidimicrobiia bacterium]
MTWDWEFAIERFPDIAKGMLVTIQATLMGMALALVVGLILALGRRAPQKWIAWPFRAVIEFIRSTPLLIQLFFLYYALPEVGVVLDPMPALVFGLGLHYGTYCSEAYRAGIDDVARGQWEASTALNLGTVTTWASVILPQAIPTSIPALGNYFVAMFKDAPLGSTISVAGVLFMARSIGSSTFRYLETLTMAGVLFLLVSIPAALFVRRLEGKYGYAK